MKVPERELRLVTEASSYFSCALGLDRIYFGSSRPDRHSNTAQEQTKHSPVLSIRWNLSYFFHYIGPLNHVACVYFSECNANLNKCED